MRLYEICRLTDETVFHSHSRIAHVSNYSTALYTTRVAHLYRELLLPNSDLLIQAVISFCHVLMKRQGFSKMALH